MKIMQTQSQEVDSASFQAFYYSARARFFLLFIKVIELRKKKHSEK